MFSRVDLKKEIRLPVVRSHPLSIYSHTHRRCGDKIHKKVHQCLALFRLPNRMFQIRRLQVEHLRARTASCRSPRRLCGVILRQNRHRSQENSQASNAPRIIHGLPPSWAKYSNEQDFCHRRLISVCLQRFCKMGCRTAYLEQNRSMKSADRSVTTVAHRRGEALSLALFVRTCHNLCVSRCRSGFGSEQLVEVSRSPSTGEFEVVIMIESVTEEMHGSNGVSDSETDYERALVAMAEPSTRAKMAGSSQCTD
jgi:hypothetical protein